MMMNSSQSQSSSASSGTTVGGSAETLPTQEIQDASYSDEEVATVPVWGRLLPWGNSCTVIDLCKEEYTFGRGETCDIQLQQTNNSCYKAYSSKHFRIFQETTNHGIVIFLEDLSSNGTFINGDKVGKSKKQALGNNDEIALALRKNRVFVYMDSNVSEEFDLPREIRDKYRLSKELGRGACGLVRLAFEKGSCKKFAMKIIAKKKFSKTNPGGLNNSTQVMSEVKILRALKHPCIIGIEDVIDTEDTLYILLELVNGGELFDRVVGLGQLAEENSKLLFYQMVVAVKYLHDEEITHRDLKPENILLATEDAETLVKVTDFGLSKFIGENTMLKTFCGTPNYLAPEIILTAGMGSYTKAIDCWSLGVILFICLVGYPPFTEERKDMALVQQITTGCYTFPTQYWNGISNQAIDLIKRLLTVEPTERITLAQALEHPWLLDKNMRNIANQLMTNGSNMPPPTLVPKKRPNDGTLHMNQCKRPAAAATPQPTIKE